MLEKLILVTLPFLGENRSLELMMRPLPVDEWTEDLKNVLDDMDGKPLNVHRLMANHPQLLLAWWNYRNYSVNAGDLEQRDGEIVILRVAARMRCWYEWASHVVRGQSAGVSLSEIERVLEGPGASGWSERDAIMIKAVDELVEDHNISTATRKTLAEHFSPNQVMDIMVIQGMYVTLSGMINTWGLELDATVRKRLPVHVTREAFETAVDASA
jgi:alkylhydroperoxidase family enzyme